MYIYENSLGQTVLKFMKGQVFRGSSEGLYSGKKSIFVVVFFCYILYFINTTVFSIRIGKKPGSVREKPTILRRLLQDLRENQDEPTWTQETALVRAYSVIAVQ